MHENSGTSIRHQADYYADPILSSRFWSGRKNKYPWCKIETGFLCGDGARVTFFARVIQQLGFWTQKIQANVDCHVGAAPSARRSTLDLSIQAYAQTLAWPRRDVPRRFTWCFFSTKYPSPAGELLRLCVYSRMIRGHERRALGALLFLLSRSEPASTDSQL